VGQYGASRKETILITFMSHSAGYQYVNEMVMLIAMVMKCKLNPSSRLALVCLYHVSVFMLFKFTLNKISSLFLPSAKLPAPYTLGISLIIH